MAAILSQPQCVNILSIVPYGCNDISVIFVNIGLGNGFVLNSIKPLPEPMMDYRQYRKEYISMHSLWKFLELYFF